MNLHNVMEGKQLLLIKLGKFFRWYSFFQFHWRRRFFIVFRFNWVKCFRFFFVLVPRSEIFFRNYFVCCSGGGERHFYVAPIHWMSSRNIFFVVYFEGHFSRDSSGGGELRSCQSPL